MLFCSPVTPCTRSALVLLEDLSYNCTRYSPSATASLASHAALIEALRSRPSSKGRAGHRQFFQRSLSTSSSTQMTTIQRLLNSGESREQKAARRKKPRNQSRVCWSAFCTPETPCSRSALVFSKIFSSSCTRDVHLQLPLSECTQL